MTRPSRNQDQLLIETAKELLPQVGLSGMSLKQVADKSGVNLGMFHYHFGTKRKFVQIVLESVLKDVLDEVEKKSLEGNTSLERLRSAFVTLGLMIQKNKEVFTSFFQDFLNQQKDVTRFFSVFFGRELEILLPLIEKAKEDGSIEPIPTRQVLAFCMASINAPILVGEAFSRMNEKTLKLAALDTELATRTAIEFRVDMAMKALSSNPGKIL